MYMQLCVIIMKYKDRVVVFKQLNLTIAKSVYFITNVNYNNTFYGGPNSELNAPR